ncbi:hypothetical protein EDB83DRAFT_2457314 [Lactarius deliciosus]|nr:hypothetical protein EDB83DRAFT_2457314 [Lactarius deliciosus]
MRLTKHFFVLLPLSTHYSPIYCNCSLTFATRTCMDFRLLTARFFHFAAHHLFSSLSAWHWSSLPLGSKPTA